MADGDFVLEEYGNVTVIAPGLTKAQLQEWSPFKNWISTLTRSLTLQSQLPTHPFHNNPYRLNKITIDSHSLFAPNKIGFLKLTADVSATTTTAADDKTSRRLPGITLLRGPSVAMLVVLIPDDVPAGRLDGACTLLTVQPRVAAGSLGFVELPAGMIDGEENFAGVAAREMKEELGLVINQSELTCLTDEVAEIRKARYEEKARLREGDGEADATVAENIPFGMYPSAGGCDEYVKIFSLERRVPRDTLQEWEGKYGGLRDEGEMITLKLVPLADLWLEGAMDSKALAAATLYRQIRQRGKQQQMG